MAPAAHEVTGRTVSIDSVGRPRVRSTLTGPPILRKLHPEANAVKVTGRISPGDPQGECWRVASEG